MPARERRKASGVTAAADGTAGATAFAGGDAPASAGASGDAPFTNGAPASGGKHKVVATSTPKPRPGAFSRPRNSGRRRLNSEASEAAAAYSPSKIRLPPLLAQVDTDDEVQYLGITQAALLRMVVSIVIIFLSGFFMSAVASVAWFRTPARGPPLPDLFHDYLPDLSGTEWEVIPDYILNVDYLCTVALLLYRGVFISVLCRSVIVYAALMVLRCITVLVTTLPDSDPHCRLVVPGTVPMSEIDYGKVWEKTLSLIIPVNPITCGDMIFSGHTAIMVMLALIWHHYYPARKGNYAVNPVKVVVWLTTFFVLMVIIAVRKHYTVDVFLGLYLTMTVWGAYHRYAHDVLHADGEFYSFWLVDAKYVYPFVRWFERGLDGDLGEHVWKTRYADESDDDLELHHDKGR